MRTKDAWDCAVSSDRLDISSRGLERQLWYNWSKHEALYIDECPDLQTARCEKHLLYLTHWGKCLGCRPERSKTGRNLLFSLVPHSFIFSSTVLWVSSKAAREASMLSERGRMALLRLDWFVDSLNAVWQLSVASWKRFRDERKLLSTTLCWSTIPLLVARSHMKYRSSEQPSWKILRGYVFGGVFPAQHLKETLNEMNIMFFKRNIPAVAKSSCIEKASVAKGEQHLRSSGFGGASWGQGTTN